MCFRPPEVDLGKMCPECGVENDMAATECKECGAPLPVMGAGAAPSAPTGAQAPAAPGGATPPAAPGSGIPAAPGPGIPKAPGPGIPKAPTGPAQ